MPALRPSELLGTLAAAGLSVILTPELALEVTPAHALTDELRSTIRANKILLVNWLCKKAGNDTALSHATDPDRWCWPHSPAMSNSEIDAFVDRQWRFTDKHVSFEEAKQLADKLLIRDRESDDRRLCLECVHLQSSGPWRCSNWQTADVAYEGLSRDLVLQLQRCDGWATDAGHATGVTIESHKPNFLSMR